MEKIGSVVDLPSVEEVILGVDTHLDLHVAVALDQLGRRLGKITVPTSTRGYARLLRWAEGLGTVGCVGIEGTSSYGVGLVRYLQCAEIPVVEVERPKRRHLHLLCANISVLLHGLCRFKPPPAVRVDGCCRAARSALL